MICKIIKVFGITGLPAIDGTQVDAESTDTSSKPAETETNTTPVDEADNDEIIGKRI